LFDGYSDPRNRLLVYSPDNDDNDDDDDDDDDDDTKI
jgi:hypothetical protein